MTTQLQAPAPTTETTEATQAPVRSRWFASLRGELAVRRANRGELARAIPSFPATRSALVLPASAMTRGTAK